jgi:hypothetical protein
MAGFGQGNKPSFGGNKTGFQGKPAGKPAAKGNYQGGEKKELPPTTHYMVSGGKGEERQFVNGTFITEIEGGFKVNIKEGIEPGLYFINKKKDKSADAPSF